MTMKQTPVVFGNARFSVYSQGCVRLEYSYGGQFSSTPSVLVGRHQAKAGAADVQVKGKQLLQSSGNILKERILQPMPSYDVSQVPQGTGRYI